MDFRKLFKCIVKCYRQNEAAERERARNEKLESGTVSGCILDDAVNSYLDEKFVHGRYGLKPDDSLREGLGPDGRLRSTAFEIIRADVVAQGPVTFEDYLYDDDGNFLNKYGSHMRLEGEMLRRIEICFRGYASHCTDAAGNFDERLAQHLRDRCSRAMRDSQISPNF